MYGYFFALVLYAWKTPSNAQLSISSGLHPNLKIRVLWRFWMFDCTSWYWFVGMINCMIPYFERYKYNLHKKKMFLKLKDEKKTSYPSLNCFLAKWICSLTVVPITMICCSVSITHCKNRNVKTLQNRVGYSRAILVSVVNHLAFILYLFTSLCCFPSRMDGGDGWWWWMVVMDGGCKAEDLPWVSLKSCCPRTWGACYFLKIDVIDEQ